MNRSEVLILIALLFGLCQQDTDGYPECRYESNGIKSCYFNTPPGATLPPVELPSCLAQAQSSKIPIVHTVDFRAEITRHIVPPYVESYTIVQQKLVNVVLTTHLIDRASLDKLIEQVKTASANLAAKLGETVKGGNRISALVNDALQQNVASISAGEETIREQQKCINEVNTNLTGIQRMIDIATTEENRESRVLAEAQRTYKLPQWGKSRYEAGGSGDPFRPNPALIAYGRVNHYRNLAEDLQNQNKTLNEHVAKQRTILITLQNTVTELKQKQTTIANITSELKRILLYLSGLNSASASLETVMKELVELDKLITPLNNIYNEMLNHHVMEPFVQGQITYETVEKFKVSVNQFTKKVLSIDIYTLDDNDDQEDEESHNTDATNDSDSVDGDDLNSDDTNFEAVRTADKKNGHGIYTWPDGHRYEGNFKDGKRNGHGTLLLASGEKYIGKWADDKRNGHGLNTWPNGYRYEGNFKDDKRNGHGLYTWPDGHRYEGNFKDDKRNGHGTMFFSDGRKYVGSWAEDNMNGHGLNTWPDGHRYEGNFKDGKRNGHGTLLLASGEKYIGKWADDNRNGHGLNTWPDGHRYEGNFKDGKKNGHGTLLLASGEKYIGKWADDKRNGHGLNTWPDGRRYEGNWKDDIFIS